MQNSHGKILFASTAVFSLAILIGVFSIVFYSIKTKGTITKAANISHYVVPILFYPADVPVPTQAEIDKIGVAVDGARLWYAQRGQTFEYLKDNSTGKVRVYQGLHDKAYYEDYNGIYNNEGSLRIMKNIYNEIAEHERLSLGTFRVPDTSFGWWDRATLIFMKGIPFSEKPPSTALAWSNSFPGRGGYSAFPSMVLDTLMHDYSTCNLFADLNLVPAGKNNVRDAYCDDGTQYGTVIHEIGHAIAGLGDPTKEQKAQMGPAACSKDIMCGGAFDIQNANFNPGDLALVQDSPFTSPPDIGSAEWNNYLPVDVMKRFCFESTDPHQWCQPGTVFAGIPVSPGENGFNLTVKNGGDCNLFGCVGPSLSTSWNNVTYRVELKCTYGAYCSNNYNQWTDCSAWPTGTCPPLDTTANSVNILAAAGFSYKYRVWIITKRDGDVNNVASYPWVNETDVSNTCSSGSCSLKLSWLKATYDTNLTLNGVVEGGMPVDACRGNWVDPANGKPSPCESAWSGTANSHTFTQLNTSITADLYVQVKDTNGASHLLQTKQNVGTTANTCTGGYCQCACTAASIPGGQSSSLAGAAGSQNVTLGWSAPGSWGQECGGNSVREYLIRFDDVNPPSPNPSRTSNLNLVLNGLKPGATYYWQVAVQNKGGKVSDYSAVRSFTTQSLIPPTPSPTFRPSGAGSMTQWTNSVPSAASHYQNVSETTADEDSSYISATADGLVDTYTHNPSGLASGTPIQSITVYARAKYVTGSTNNMVSPMIISGGVRKNQDITISNSYANYFATFTVDPATNQPWTVAGADAIQIGVRKSYAGADVRVTQVWAQVNYAGLDSDNDGFGDWVETYMGTDPYRACGVNAWPPDVNNDGVVNSIDQALVSAVFGAIAGDAKYNKRYDLNASGSISIGDLALQAKYFGKTCV